MRSLIGLFVGMSIGYAKTIIDFGGDPNIFLYPRVNKIVKSFEEGYIDLSGNRISLIDDMTLAVKESTRGIKLNTNPRNSSQIETIVNCNDRITAQFTNRTTNRKVQRFELIEEEDKYVLKDPSCDFDCDEVRFNKEEIPLRQICNDFYAFNQPNLMRLR